MGGRGPPEGPSLIVICPHHDGGVVPVEPAGVDVAAEEEGAHVAPVQRPAARVREEERVAPALVGAVLGGVVLRSIKGVPGRLMQGVWHISAQGWWGDHAWSVVGHSGVGHVWWARVVGHVWWARMVGHSVLLRRMQERSHWKCGISVWYISALLLG